MKILPNQLYHIYNQGNNKETIFREKSDYLRFLEKLQEKALPYCQIVNYCLMPNHFHLLVNTTNESATEVRLGNLISCKLANAFRLLCSGYANDFNKKYNRSGSLFRQKTQAKLLENGTYDYPLICFHYIHQNPVKAGLCNKLEDWEFSSFRDYLGLRTDTIVEREIAYDLIGIHEKSFYEDSHAVIREDKMRGLISS
jgi:putative transposase